MASWFSMKARANSDIADIAIYNEIGGFGVTAADFARELEALGAPEVLRVSISSDGGDIATGYAIFNMLSRHTARKVMRVDGLAASMASVILMAGDERIVAKNAMVMIHNPWGHAIGEADQIISFGEALGKMRDAIIESYADTTGLPAKKIAAMMDRETWLDAKEALQLGFATRIGEPVKMAAASYDISKFHNVPVSFKEFQMTSKSQANNNPEADEFEGEAQSAEEIRAELLARHREIRSLCKLANKAELADQFIEEDMQVSDVIARLSELRLEEDKKSKGKPSSVEVSARHNPNKTGGEPRMIDVAKIYDRWNASGRRAA